MSAQRERDVEEYTEEVRPDRPMKLKLRDHRRWRSSAATPGTAPGWPGATPPSSIATGFLLSPELRLPETKAAMRA